MLAWLFSKVKKICPKMWKTKELFQEICLMSCFFEDEWDTRTVSASLDGFMGLCSNPLPPYIQACSTIMPKCLNNLRDNNLLLFSIVD